MKQSNCTKMNSLRYCYSCYFFPVAFCIFLLLHLYQERENKYLGYKGVGKFFNVTLPSTKGVQNLDLLHHAASYEDDRIQYGFGKDVLYPHGYVKSGHLEEKIGNSHFFF